jgi:activated RNA polymerase II transcriptional coactivator p15
MDDETLNKTIERVALSSDEATKLSEIRARVEDELGLEPDALKDRAKHIQTVVFSALSAQEKGKKQKADQEKRKKKSKKRESKHSDDDEETSRKKKRQRRSDAKEEAEEKECFALGSDLCRATVNQFRGRNLVDLRKYFVVRSTNEVKPTKKGISLSVEQWQALTANAERIDALIHAKKTKHPGAAQNKEPGTP